MDDLGEPHFGYYLWVVPKLQGSPPCNVSAIPPEAPLTFLLGSHGARRKAVAVADATHVLVKSRGQVERFHWDGIYIYTHVFCLFVYLCIKPIICILSLCLSIKSIYYLHLTDNSRSTKVDNRLVWAKVDGSEPNFQGSTMALFFSPILRI